jgi:hypothetical protein
MMRYNASPSVTFNAAAASAKFSVTLRRETSAQEFQKIGKKK